MLRFFATLILALGIFSFAGAKESPHAIHVQQVQELEDMTAMATIDPVVRRAVLKQCSKIWEFSFLDLEDAYAKGDLTIEEAMYGTDLAYDVNFDGQFLCVLESDL